MRMIRVHAVVPRLLALSRVRHRYLVDIGLQTVVHTEALCEGLYSDSSSRSFCRRVLWLAFIGGERLGDSLLIYQSIGLNHAGAGHEGVQVHVLIAAQTFVSFNDKALKKLY